MHVQPLSWEYIGNEKCLWLGKTNGLLSHVEIFISASLNAHDEYVISSSINGFENNYCLGIDNAKTRAQDLLNSYAISLILS
jgi:hypothetical protein